MVDYKDKSNTLSFFDKVSIFFHLLPTPIVFAWAIIKSPFSSYGRAKSVKRILADQFIRRICVGLSRKQALAVLGSTMGLYEDFMRSRGSSPNVEEIGADSRLLWIGERRTDRVILYLHGGAMILPMPGFAPHFYSYIKDSLEKRGKPTGVAILNYTLVPDQPYPTQLKQTLVAIQHLLDSGVRPQDIQLAGDSAGALLMHGVFSHLLHPLDGMPNLKLSAPLGGAYMLSPWPRQSNKNRCLHACENSADFLDGNTLEDWGRWVIEGVPESLMPYLEANSSPEGWMSGVDKCVKRIMMSAGSEECLRDEIVIYGDMMKRYHPEVKFVMHKNAVHNDPYTDFMAGETNPGQVTPMVVDFFYEGFEKTG